MGQGSNNKKKTNPILWLFFAIIIPIVIAIVLTVFVLNISGVDVSGWAKDQGKKIPGISSLIKEDEKKENVNKENRKNTEADKISELQDKVQELEEQNFDLKQDYLKLENEKDSLESLLDSDEEDEPNKEQKQKSSPAKDTANSFRKMKPKQAALIIQDMESSRANEILHELSNDVRGKILEEMDPEKARKLINARLDES